MGIYDNYPFRRPPGRVPVKMQNYPDVMLVGRFAYDTAWGFGEYHRVREPKDRAFWRQLFDEADQLLSADPDNKNIYHFVVQGHDLYASWYDGRITLSVAVDYSGKLNP